VVKYQDKPKEIWRVGGDKQYLSPEAMRATRIPGGHPEGFIEAFANLYKEVAGAIRDRLENKSYNAENYDFPTVEDGLRGMAFIENLIASSNSDQKWHKFEY
jgi:predicted dehydrogenase